MVANKGNLQRDLFDPAQLVAGALERLSRSEVGERGAIFTRREVVEFILDLVGYTADKPLWKMRLLEPSFGGGDFLEIVMERLLQAWKRGGLKDVSLLDEAITSIEVHIETFKGTCERLRSRLLEAGLNQTNADRLIDQWLHCEDFLLKPLETTFDIVVGNPPYVRQEMIPNELLAEYRRQFVTMYDRADLYVPFIEKSLCLLKDGGSMAFICSDRWMKNRYGGPLRSMVSDGFHLKYYVDMVDTPAFTSEVSAYPAITVISKENSGPTRVAHRPEISQQGLKKLAGKLRGNEEGIDETVHEVPKVMAGVEPWVLEEDSLGSLGLVRRLESQFPTLEEAGCKVGIGVATGADRVFIGMMDDLDVEPSRKLPLVMTRDIEDGHVSWHGLGVINPFGDDGKAVNLADFPKLKRYFEKHEKDLRKRHIAQKSGGCWYRTIDKITPSLAKTPKLLIPDIKGTAHVVYEGGDLYPHHNLYFIVSQEWDLKALQAVLISGLARLFVATYSTKMRGGWLRFQAQYLRRIHLPRWESITPSLRQCLVAAVEAQDENQRDKIVAQIFGLSVKEQELIATN